jgi:threonine/homoserine/homoserine lactone efflux protein
MFGLAPFLKQDWVFAAIAIIGGVMLGFMGAGMLRSIPLLSIHKDIQVTQGTHLVLSGVLMSVSNPYWSLWWATIGLGYVLYSSQFGPWGIIFFFIGHILGDLTWYSAVSMAMAKGKRFLNDTHYRVLIGACAVFLLLLAGYFAYSGINRALALT